MQINKNKHLNLKKNIKKKNKKKNVVHWLLYISIHLLYIFKSKIKIKSERSTFKRHQHVLYIL